MPRSSIHYFRSDVPVGESGEWRVAKVKMADRPYNASEDTRPDCFKFRPGEYTYLERSGTHYMSDLYDEWWTQREAIQQARLRGGNVLITGLGLGLVAEAILRATNAVTSITIVERSADVIQLVASHLLAKHAAKIEIVHADAFAWTPSEGKVFTVGWHDIWPDPYGEEVEKECRLLETRFGKWCDWQGSWPRHYLKELVK